MTKYDFLKNEICHKRIKILRMGIKGKTSFVSQSVLSDRLRVANSNISRDRIKVIELGKRDILDIEIIWFAKIFDVSVAYLIGISDDYNAHFDLCDSSIDDSLKNQKNISGVWIKNARERQNAMPQEKLASIMNERGFNFKTHTAISSLENGLRRVRLSEMRAFSEILNVPIIFFFKGTHAFLPNIESYESFVAQDD